MRCDGWCVLNDKWWVTKYLLFQIFDSLLAFDLSIITTKTNYNKNFYLLSSFFFLPSYILNIMVVVNYPNSVKIISFSCNVVIFSKNSYGSINSFSDLPIFSAIFLVVILLSAFIAANTAPSVLDIFSILPWTLIMSKRFLELLLVSDL